MKTVGGTPTVDESYKYLPSGGRLAKIVNQPTTSLRPSRRWRVPKISEDLDVTADQLLGMASIKDKEGAKNSRLWCKLRQFEKLPLSDRRALLKMLDAFLAQQRS